MGTKFGMGMINTKEIIEKDAYFTNYECFVKTNPLHLKFGLETTKFKYKGMEMSNIKSNIKERIENNAYLINYAWFVKTSPLDLKFGMDDGEGI